MLFALPLAYTDVLVCSVYLQCLHYSSLQPSCSPSHLVLPLPCFAWCMHAWWWMSCHACMSCDFHIIIHVSSSPCHACMRAWRWHLLSIIILVPRHHHHHHRRRRCCRRSLSTQHTYASFASNSIVTRLALSSCSLRSNSFNVLYMRLLQCSYIHSFLCYPIPNWSSIIPLLRSTQTNHCIAHSLFDFKAISITTNYYTKFVRFLALLWIVIFSSSRRCGLYAFVYHIVHVVPNTHTPPSPQTRSLPA